MTARAIDGMHVWRTVSYYRCTSCGHVWSVDRQDPEHPRTVIVVEPMRIALRQTVAHTLTIGLEFVRAQLKAGRHIAELGQDLRVESTTRARQRTLALDALSNVLRLAPRLSAHDIEDVRDGVMALEDAIVKIPD